MDEYVDIITENGEKTGRTCLKSEAHKNGILHASVHIWIFDTTKNVLNQKRAANKDTFPNLWDVSVAGHISAGEMARVSALREAEEEVGLTINSNQLTFLTTFRKKIHHHKNLIDFELHYIYLCEINFDIGSLKIQKEEVSDATSIKLADLTKQVKTLDNNFVPHGADYYELLFNEIANYTS